MNDPCSLLGDLVVLAGRMESVMFGGEDPYWKLRPELPVPPDEFCKCTDSPPIVVQDRLSSMPLACLRCNGAVPPEKIGFSESLAGELHYWLNVHRALYMLWLVSGEYEEWARVRLEDPAGSVNIDGLEVVAKLNKYRPTYYWWFQDFTAANYAPMSDCPRCAEQLVEHFGRMVCHGCSVVVPMDDALGRANTLGKRRR